MSYKEMQCRNMSYKRTRSMEEAENGKSRKKNTRKQSCPTKSRDQAEKLIKENLIKTSSMIGNTHIKHPILYDEEWVYRKYIKEKHTIDEIADIIGCEDYAVRNAIRRCNIPMYSRKETNLMKLASKFPYDKKWLHTKYVIDRLTTTKIASLVNMSKKDISDLLEFLNIDKENNIRNQSKYPLLYNKEWLSKKYWKEGLFSSKKLGELIGCSGTTVLNAMKKHDIKTVPSGNKLDYLDLSKEKMEELYVINKLTAQEVGKYMGCDAATILHRLKEYNIPIKHHIRYRDQNLLEQKVEKTLQDLYPNEWKFNGCGECGVVLGGLIPDFINVNGMKAVIEVFGDGYHDPEKAFRKVPWKSQEFGRKAVFSQLGYECIILRECDLNDNCEKTITDNVEAIRGAM